MSLDINSAENQIILLLGLIHFQVLDHLVGLLPSCLLLNFNMLCAAIRN